MCFCLILLNGGLFISSSCRVEVTLSYSPLSCKMLQISIQNLIWLKNERKVIRNERFHTLLQLLLTLNFFNALTCQSTQKKQISKREKTSKSLRQIAILFQAQRIAGKICTHFILYYFNSDRKLWLYATKFNIIYHHLNNRFYLATFQYPCQIQM